MKKTILSIASICVVIFATAQQTPHTLQYSRTLLVSSVGGTVPSAASNNGIDCVWKVVSVLPSANVQQNVSGNNGSPLPLGTFSISVNSNTIYLTRVDAAFGYNGYDGGSYGFTNVNGELLPMWLPAGTTLAAGSNIQYVSVIEFIVN